MDQSDNMIKFEEKNYDWLLDKFMKIPKVMDLWSDFIYYEYEASLPDEPPDYSEDR